MANIALWGVTDSGFYCPTYEEILSDKILRAKETFGEDIATSGLTPLGKFLRIEAATDRKLYESLEQVYYSFSPATATGVSLDRLCAFAQITRKPAQCAVHSLRVYGTQGYVIKAGTLFRSKAGITFYTVADATIDTDEPGQNNETYFYTNVIVQCTTAGTAGNVANIISTVSVNNNISSIVYLEQLTRGSNTETDAELRERFGIMISGLGRNTTVSIITAVSAVPGVYKCIVENNTTDDDWVISENLTIEKNTYGVIVYASGQDSEIGTAIAKAIFSKQPFGVRQSGLTIVGVRDDADEDHNVKFTYVTEKNPEIVISCDVNSTFERTGSAQILENILNYVNALNIGDNLIFSRIYQRIYEVTGVVDVTKLTVDGDTKNVDVSMIEIIRCNKSNITLTITEV